MTASDKGIELVTILGMDHALYHIDEIREELLKQFNLHYPESTVGFWCNSEECKFWSEVKEAIANEDAVIPDHSERWEKEYVKTETP